MNEQIKEMFAKPIFERVLLSYCFVSVENYYVISSAISDNDFLRPEHKLIWVILGFLLKRGVSKFDASMIVDESKKNDVFEKIGGYEYITAVIGLDAFDSDIQYYIGKVIDASTKYQLYMKLNYDLKKIGDEAANDDITAVDMIGRVSNDVMTLSMQSKAVKEATNLSDGIDEYIEERRGTPIEFCGLSTGYDILDKRIDGLIPGTLTVLCARPKVGKSTFLCNVGAYTAYNLLKPVLYIDTEMDFDQWRDRIIAMLSGVPERRVKHGGYTDQEYYNIKQATSIIKKGKFFHEYMPGYSIDKISAVYRKYNHVENIGLAIFDYIKEPPGGSKDRKEYQILGDVTTALKDLAGELQIPFMCANQLNRQLDIADSDRILRYADVLMIFQRRNDEELKKISPFEKEYGFHKLMITDSRRGGITAKEGIGYSFHKKCLQISEASKQLVDYDVEKEEDEEKGVVNEFSNTEEQSDNESSF